MDFDNIIDEYKYNIVDIYFQEKEAYLKNCLQILFDSSRKRFYEKKDDEFDEEGAVKLCFDILRRDEPVDNIVNDFCTYIRSCLDAIILQIQIPATRSVE